MSHITGTLDEIRALTSDDKQVSQLTCDGNEHLLRDDDDADAFCMMLLLLLLLLLLLDRPVNGATPLGGWGGARGVQQPPEAEKL